jgi:hypothetical protein
MLFDDRCQQDYGSALVLVADDIYAKRQTPVPSFDKAQLQKNRFMHISLILTATNGSILAIP